MEFALGGERRFRCRTRGIPGRTRTCRRPYRSRRTPARAWSALHTNRRCQGKNGGAPIPRGWVPGGQHPELGQELLDHLGVFDESEKKAGYDAYPDDREGVMLPDLRIGRMGPARQQGKQMAPLIDYHKSKARAPGWALRDDHVCLLVGAIRVPLPGGGTVVALCLSVKSSRFCGRSRRSLGFRLGMCGQPP